MKKFTFVLTLTFLFVANFIFAQKHLWQSPKYPPIIQFNQKGQMAVYTYDRLSIYNVESGALEKSYDFLKNRNSYIWPFTIYVQFSEDFKNFRFHGKSPNVASYKAYPVIFFSEKEEWGKPYELIDEKSISGLDVQGREIVKYNKKKEFWLHKANGGKIKKIANTDYINILRGGRFGVYKEGDQMKLFDFSTDTSTPLEFKSYPDYESVRNGFHGLYFFKEGDKFVVFNPFTKEKEELKPNTIFPSKYNACKGSNKDYYYGDYSYKIAEDQSALDSDKYGAVPYIIEQYNASDCSLVKQFEISVSEKENMAKTEDIAFIYEGVRKIDKTFNDEVQARKDSDAAMAQKFANKKEAAELVKELLINFQEAGTAFATSLIGMKGRDISNIPYTKKYLTHLNGEIYALAKFTNCKTSNIFLVAVRNGATTHFKLIKTHYEGEYRETMDLASVNAYGGKLNSNLSIFLTNMGYSIKAELTKTLANGNQEKETLFAPCSSAWK